VSLLTLSDSLTVYLVVGAILFAIGLFGMMHRRNIIGMLISGELILAAASLNFMAFQRFLSPTPVAGAAFTLFIMGLAAAEAAIVLSIVVAVYRNYKSIDTRDSSELEG
jgi:NADH:ubiquinone oxidoreductase subunit K